MADSYDEDEPTEMMDPNALREVLRLAKAAKERAKAALTPAPVKRAAAAPRAPTPAPAMAAAVRPVPQPAVSNTALMMAALGAVALLGLAAASVTLF